MAQQANNGGDVLGNIANNPGPTAKDSKEKKGPDTLFGPNIGVISGGPAWTNATEKKVLKDELTIDAVKSWIEKSKEPSQPTTTLQALVNLKRPTIRLSPLTAAEGEDHHQQHALEFEYDCDAPKCGIYVHVLLPPGHPDAPPPVLVFESVVEGGFGNVLKLEEGAVLELGRYEMSPQSLEKSVANAGPSHSISDTSVPTANAEPTTTSNLSANGPALAVVDASSSAPAPSNETDKMKKVEADDGIKVIIRLAALDEQRAELASPNEQVTYLSVERFGTKVKPVPATVPAADVSGSGTSAEEGKAEAVAAEVKSGEEEDTRPWVVKVVKREATIGPHTFHLHEIYGLTSSSSSTHTHAPTAPLPSAHTYPPATGAAAPAAESNDTNDDSPSECLLCLSSPREVVLLPCRHLVACKDCALNMVEFGAGGNITQPSEDPASAPADGAAGEGGEGGASGSVTAAAPITNTRRKRKAKGWFCPVCRQPYTSLLRITTTPPPAEGKTETTPNADAAREESEDEEVVEPDQDIADADRLPSGLPLPVTAEPPSGTSTQPQNADGSNSASGGLFTRPGFLRGITNRGNASPRGDLESQL
ncbi:hypothetical protein BT96DRAFT_964040 [Gymnopus androsaceus JB14]|uniref:RING-type domain-containing protein n=1 Tax=Gymnopus androsaceus JB14 TaxID=1447944 RepID=A0A6A4I2L9_9AGAR|nr:hypothetical protein BT96DRAFT_964040 [Gymnopus androsaceus JB14]